MKTISRRRFIATSVMGLAAAGHRFSEAMESAAGHIGTPPGCPISPIRKQLIQDFDGTLREVM